MLLLSWTTYEHCRHASMFTVICTYPAYVWPMHAYVHLGASGVQAAVVHCKKYSMTSE